MTIAAAFDIGLAALVLAVAGWTIAARQTFAAVVGFIAYGLLLTLVWVRLSAIDVALTEAAIGSGVTGVLLLRATAGLKGGEAPRETPGTSMRLVIAALCATITIGLAAVVLLLPDPAPTLAPIAIENLPKTALGNPVTAVLMSYRAFDTFLEKVVLLLALVGVWSLTSDRSWGGAPSLPRPAGANGALMFLAQVLPPIGIVVGIYMFWAGADVPGGAFQGGAILAAMAILVVMAGLASLPAIGGVGLRFVLVVGAAAFLVAGLAGVVLADAFLAYPSTYTKALIIAIEAAMTLSIAATLALLVAGPPGRREPR